MMKKMQKEITDWQDATFGPAPSLVRLASRANEEMAELLRSIASDDHPATIAGEVADVVIVLFRLANECGCFLDEEISRKMSINYKRKWGPDKSGHVYHIPEEELA